MLVGLSTLIEYEMSQSKLFSYFYGTDFKVFTLNSSNASYSLRENEKKKIISLTVQVAVHLVMVIEPESEVDSRSVNKNKLDLVNKFLLPIFKVCKKHSHRIANALSWTDNEKFKKSIVSKLKKHSYYKEFDQTRVLFILNDLISKLDFYLIKNTPVDESVILGLLNKLIDDYK